MAISSRNSTAEDPSKGRESCSCSRYVAHSATWLDSHLTHSITDFLGNFLVVEVTPVGLQNIGYKFYIVWAVLNVANAVIVWCCYPETTGLPLEAVDDIFTADSGLEPSQGLASKFQWQYVGKSKQAVKYWRNKSKAAGGRRESVEAAEFKGLDDVDASSGSDESGKVTKRGGMRHIEHAS